MIQIKNQDANFQYDADGRKITQWNSERKEWMVLPEFENEKINWWGRDNDFPGAFTEKEYQDLVNEHPSYFLKSVGKKNN